LSVKSSYKLRRGEGTRWPSPRLFFLGAAVLILILLYGRRREESVAKYLLVCWGAGCFLYALFVTTQPTLWSRAIEGGIAFAIGAIACGIAFVLERLDRRRIGQRKEPERME
jgi:peptidoglycan/LPS O-acetylase OafA/YrhL